MSLILHAKNLPPRVEKLVKEITEKSPKYTEAQVWATAWSIYCKHIKPGDGHCSKGPDDYLTHQAGARTAMNYTTVSTTTLPKAVIKVLAEVRFNKRKISVTQATSFSMYSAGDDGAKGFTALVDIDTNQTDVTWGAFGGGGLGTKPSPVDDVNTPKKSLPDHLVVVQGQIGGRDPYASIICTPTAFARLTGAPRVASTSGFISEKVTALAKVIGSKLKAIKAPGDAKPNLASNAGGFIMYLFKARKNNAAYQHVQTLFGRMSDVGTGFGVSTELEALAHETLRHFKSDADVVGVGLVLLGGARRPRAAAAFETWANQHIDMAPAEPALSPDTAFESEVTPEIQKLAALVWAKLRKSPKAAQAFAFNLAEDVNWHSIKSVTYDPDEVMPNGLVSGVSSKLSYDLIGMAALVVALFRVAGMGAQAAAVKAEAVREFADDFVPQERTAMNKTAYFTVLLPPGSSQWQSPTKVLSRGAFKTRREAFEWAAKNVPGVKVTIDEYDDPEVVEKAMIAVAVEVHKNGEQGTFLRNVNPVGAKALMEDHLVESERGYLYPKQPAFDHFFKTLHGVHASVTRVAARYVRAFNKFNAPELVSQLLTVLEQEGLKDALNQVKMKKVPEIVEKAWASRGKTAAVKVPVTIRDWMLYKDPGAGPAAKALTTALKAGQKALLATLALPAYKRLDPEDSEDHAEKLGTLIRKVYRTHVAPVQGQHADFGAYDTEPTNVAIQSLVDTAKDFYGIRARLDLGDYL